MMITSAIILSLITVSSTLGIMIAMTTISVSTTIPTTVTLAASLPLLAPSSLHNRGLVCRLFSLLDFKQRVIQNFRHGIARRPDRRTSRRIRPNHVRTLLQLLVVRVVFQ
jgi:hypothetical protein